MKYLLSLVLLGIGVAAQIAGGEGGNAGDSPSSGLSKLQQEFEEAEAALHKAGEALPEGADAEAKALWNRFAEKDADLRMAAVALAKSNPGYETGFSALQWVLESNRAYDIAAGKEALQVLSEQYAEDPRFGGFVASLGYYFPYPQVAAYYQDALDFLTTVANEHPDRKVRGQASLGLAGIAKRQFSRAEGQGLPEADALATKAIASFEYVISEYGDCPSLRVRGVRPAKESLREEAERDLNELRNLRRGMIAPETAAEDLDGKVFKLTDYRGKVVLLVFWASWCQPCMAEVPDEKKLVEHFKDRPFVILGVNGDNARKDALKAVADHEIPWRSFSNGPLGPTGPITEIWNVRRWPTTFVLDHEGVIRHKNSRGQRLVDDLESLVVAAELTDVK